MPGRFLIVFILALLVAPIARADSVSYNASSNALPPSPWFRYTAPLPLGFDAPQSVSGGTYQMGPTDTGSYTFWLLNSLVLDHTQTVELSARLRLVSESSNDTTNRAGLAIALTDDQNRYSEFYIRPGEVFLNKRDNNLRVRDTAFSMDTSTAFHDYTMRLNGSTITIFIDGVQRLSGSTFDASGIALPTLQNSAAFGDITSQSQSTWQMQSMSVNVFVPEPAMLAVSMLLLSLVSRRPSR